ncbi:MAG: hypothetical protein H7336_14915 [Bacteriovorax sp.]|nr:hypothetical protein [Bacteriovorax sp.]
MKITTPKELRSELKTYLDHASKGPVKIKRRSGKNYILISEERYLELADIPPMVLKKQHAPIKSEKKSEKKSKKTTKKAATTTKKEAKDPKKK